MLDQGRRCARIHQARHAGGCDAARCARQRKRF